MSYDLRPLRASDEEGVVMLVAELYHRHRDLIGFQWPPETLRAEFHSTDGWGVFKGQRVVGFVMYRLNPAAWEISVVACHPDFWHQGLTRSLISQLVVIKPADKELWLEVHHENTRAWQLYESLGFVKTGERLHYYPGGGTAWLYTLR